MAKVVYNACFGGFSLSDRALDLLCERGHPLALKEREDLARPLPEGESEALRRAWATMAKDSHFVRGIPRHDPMLVAVVEELGEVASGKHAKLKVQEISGSLYRIDEYDGSESVQEPDGIEWINVDAPAVVDPEAEE